MLEDDNVSTISMPTCRNQASGQAKFLYGYFVYRVTFALWQWKQKLTFHCWEIYVYNKPQEIASTMWMNKA